MGSIIYDNQNVAAPYSGKEYNLQNLPYEDKITLQAVTYFSDHFECTDLTRRIVTAFNYWIKAPNDKLERNHELCRIWKNGHLVYNDLIYDTKARHEKATAHCVYGIPQTLNAFFFSGLSPTWIEDKYLSKATNLTNRESLRLSRIRNLLIALRHKLICPDEQLYFKLSGYRGTISLLTQEIEFLQELYGTTQNGKFEEFVNNIKIFLTIIDECRRIATNNPEDLTEGYFSFPIIHAMKASEDNEEPILNVMRQRTSDPAVLNFALTLIQKSTSFEYAREKLHSLKEEILRDYKQFPKNPLMDEFFEEYLHIPQDFNTVKWELS